ncbi:hypothetical protein D6D24_06859 [Aureobasidium pullulans]|uniref:Uncharacterized protein n=1 Tax=Aureobasidium pullulans TaxID=5580 RepID=A0A4V4IAL2_AURPU|nr:hypothetical protein D6D24_06859 [Aureobasidium pullulans]
MSPAAAHREGIDDVLVRRDPVLEKKDARESLAIVQTPEYFQAGLNAREMAHIYHDSERDTKYYVQHGTLPQELLIPAWDHLAIGEPQAEPKHEDFASTAPETNNNSPGTPRRPVPALKNSANPPSAADPKGPRSITELQDLRNISDYGSST